MCPFYGKIYTRDCEGVWLSLSIPLLVVSLFLPQNMKEKKKETNYFTTHHPISTLAKLYLLLFNSHYVTLRLTERQKKKEYWYKYVTVSVLKVQHYNLFLFHFNSNIMVLYICHFKVPCNLENLIYFNNTVGLTLQSLVNVFFSQTVPFIIVWITLTGINQYSYVYFTISHVNYTFVLLLPFFVLFSIIE